MLAELPAGQGVITRGVRIQTSHLYANDSLEALNDDHAPSSSIDHSIPRMTWWDHKGSTEWVSYSFPGARSISACAHLLVRRHRRRSVPRPGRLASSLARRYDVEAGETDRAIAVRHHAKRLQPDYL